MRGIIYTIAVIAAGTAALWAGTDGFHVLTAEGARRMAVQNTPQPLPAVELTDQRGEAFRLTDLKGQVVLIEFIYTRCTTICTQLGETFSQVQERTKDRDVTLVSISFDPRDTTGDLRAYAERYDAIPSTWRVAKVTDFNALPALLDFFAVTVIADGNGDFEHNAAVLLADRQGRLVDIVDDQPADIPMEALWKWL